MTDVQKGGFRYRKSQYRKIKVLCITIAAITLACAGFSAYTVFGENRSIMSKIAEIVLHISYGKKPFKNETELAAFLEERRAENAQPYIRLKSIRLDACVQETVFEGMQ